MYPDWAIAVGWFSSLISMICIPIGIIYTLKQSKGTLYEVSIQIHMISQEMVCSSVPLWEPQTQQICLMLFCDHFQ